jgi:hypothetical protein
LLFEEVTTTFCFRNMSALPPIQWTEQEKTSGAVRFSQHLSELHDKLTTSTPSPAVSTTSRSTVEKIVHVVETVVPQIVETLQHEFVEPTTTVVSVGTGVTTTSPTTIHFTTTPTTTTTSVIPPPDCRPTDNVQVSLYL